MVDPYFNAKDLAQIEAYGISRAEVGRQIEQLLNPPPYAELVRPCRQGDGVKVLAPQIHARLLERFETAVKAGRITKFVPASGAATRMFRRLLSVLAESPVPDRALLEKRAAAKDETAAAVLTFIDRIDAFAFSEELMKKLTTTRKATGRIESAIDIESALKLLIRKDTGAKLPGGLGLAARPKALIPFHLQGDRGRTALEEHFAEALEYTRDGEERCRLHFTISEDHRDRFEQQIYEICEILRTERGIKCDVTLSTQSKATDTIALTPEGLPFRVREKSVLFRPGGHGALIYNLDEMDADIVLIKNIDNITPLHLRADTILWKKLLAGCLIDLQDQSFDLLKKLQENEWNEELLGGLRN